MKIDLGQGPTPHAEGNFVTPTGTLGLRADWLADAGVDTLPVLRPARRRPPTQSSPSASRSR